MCPDSSRCGYTARRCIFISFFHWLHRMQTEWLGNHLKCKFGYELDSYLLLDKNGRAGAAWDPLLQTQLIYLSHMPPPFSIRIQYTYNILWSTFSFYICCLLFSQTSFIEVPSLWRIQRIFSVLVLYACCFVQCLWYEESSLLYITVFL